MERKSMINEDGKKEGVRKKNRLDNKKVEEVTIIKVTKKLDDKGGWKEGK